MYKLLRIMRIMQTTTQMNQLDSTSFLSICDRLVLPSWSLGSAPPARGFLQTTRNLYPSAHHSLERARFFCLSGMAIKVHAKFRSSCLQYGDVC